MTENVWNIDELIALTDEVQNGETEYNGKNFDFQYCELTEGEEPKLKFPGSGASEEDQNEAYKEIGQARILAMILKANKKNPEGTTLTKEHWELLPTTLKYTIANKVIGLESNQAENFISG